MEQINLTTAKKKFLTFFPYALSVLLIVALVLTINKSKDIITENTRLTVEREVLDEQRVVLLDNQKKLEKQHNLDSTNSEAIKAELATAKKNYKTLKQKYDAKINDVDSYTISELQKFFSDRYGEESNP